VEWHVDTEAPEKMIEITHPLTVHDLADLIHARKPACFVRYGNGEWDCTLGTGQQTGSRSQHFTPELRQAMAETIIAHDGKIMGIQSQRYLERCRLWRPASQWLFDRGLMIDWAVGDVLHYASRDGMLYPFISALRQHPDVVMVGPEWLERLDIDHRLLVVPSVDAWAVVDPVVDSLRKLDPGACVCLSAGPAAKVIAHRLRGADLTVIDCGSVWDVFCWRPSRRYHHEMAARTVEANLYGHA
jgi:hypothetical protein